MRFIICGKWLANAASGSVTSMERRFVVVRFFCSSSNENPRRKTFHENLLNKYERYLETKHPKFYKLHRIVFDGSKSCYHDLLTYRRVRSEIQSGKPLSELTRHELEVFVLMPKDMLKILVLLICEWVPIVGELLLVAIVFYPRLLLTRHFWTFEQTTEFNETVLAMRRKHYFHKAATFFVDSAKQDRTQLDLSSLSAVIASSSDVSLSDQIKSENLFRLPSVQIEQIPWSHKLVLGRCHGMVPLFKSGERLQLRAKVLRALDDKLRSEDVSIMPPLDLYMSLFVRQLNAAHMSDEQRRQALRTWLKFTSGDKPDSWILHAPIFSQLSQIKSI